MYQDATWLDTAGRLLISYFFLAAGIRNVRPAQVSSHLARLAALGMPFPAVAFWTGMTLQFAGCVLLLADWHAAIGVMFLIVFTIAANVLYHRYWTIADPVRRDAVRVLLLNGIAITGGLLLLLQNVR